MIKLCSATFVLVSFVAMGARGGDAKKDLDLLEGKWSITAYEEKGEKGPEDMIKVMEATFRGEQLTIRDKDKILLEFKLKIDPAKKPKTIDFTHISGEDKGKTEQGIYELTGDTLRIRVDDSGKIRPKEFKTSAELPYSLVVLKKK